MAGTKRPLPADEEQARPGSDTVHPSRKRRLDQGESNAELSKIFNELRDEISSARLDATKKLLQTLSTKSDGQAEKLDSSITRLIKGVCSNAKAARPGFSVALVEVLRLGFAAHLKLKNVVDKTTALTNVESAATGEEKRSYLIGRRCAFQAILQSGVLDKATTDEAKYLFDAITDLASQRDWLRGECGAMLHEFLRSQDAAQLADEIVRSLIDSLVAKGLLKSPEGVAIWLTVKKSFESVKLPKGHWHHNNPLSSQDRPSLTKILLKNAVEDEDSTDGEKRRKAPGARQAAPSFAWQVIMGFLFKEDDRSKFASFWEDCVAKPMFSSSSSTERKSLGLQIVSKAIAVAPISHLGHVIHTNVVRCIIDQRAKADRFLFEAAKVPLNQMVSRSKNEAGAAAAIVGKLLIVLPSNVDKFTKTTIEAMLHAADEDGLGEIVATLVSLCRTPGNEDPDEADKKRRYLADILLTIVRSRRSEPAQYFQSQPDESPVGLTDWLADLLRSFAHLAYCTPAKKISPPLSDACRSVFRERLMSSLGLLIDLPLRQAIVAPSLVVEMLHQANESLVLELDDKARIAVKEARKNLKDATKKVKTIDSNTATVTLAFQLLLAMGMLQVYKQEPDSVGALEDINMAYQRPRGDNDASSMLFEVLFSLVSQQSSLLRKLAEQVFAAFASDMTPEALDSIISILSEKEGLGGQQALYKGEDDEAEEDDEDDEDNDVQDDAEDVEDASDVEIAHGNIVNHEEDDSASNTSGSSSDSAASSPTSSLDEETEFDRKLAAALGTSTENGDDSSDDSDMDDEQMLALEPHLTQIFSQRKKTATKKQQSANAKQDVLAFKNRILDLLKVYVKSQHASPLALDLLHPLCALARTTTSPITAKKALEVLESYFDASKKHKALPDLPAAEPVWKILTAVHEDMRAGGSKVHAHACSRASLFLGRILTQPEGGLGGKEKREENFARIDAMYGTLRREWKFADKTKVQGSVLNDWHNWCMQR